MSILRANGDGTFVPGLSYQTANNPTSLTVGDFNEDGRLDLAVANPGSHVVGILHGDGDCTFTAGPDHTLPWGLLPYRLTCGDVDGDGHLDLVTANRWNDSASVLLGNGDGTFADNVDYTTGTNPDNAIIADFDGDGRADLATANAGSDTVTVLLNGAGAADGTKTVEAEYKDATDNVLALSDDIVLDTVKPVTDDDAPLGWAGLATTVTLTATDGLSGVERTQYKLDDAPDWTTYTEPIEIAADGDHTLTYRSTDNAGNIEETKTCHVQVDTTPPTTADNAGSAWHAAPFTLTLTPTDALSGMSGGAAKTEYSLDGGVSWVTGTSKAFTSVWKRGGGSGDLPLLVRSTDALGNTETPRTVHVMTDTAAPISSDDAPADPQASDVTVHTSRARTPTRASLSFATRSTTALGCAATASPSRRSRRTRTTACTPSATTPSTTWATVRWATTSAL